MLQEAELYGLQEQAPLTSSFQVGSTNGVPAENARTEKGKVEEFIPPATSLMEHRGLIQGPHLVLGGLSLRLPLRALVTTPSFCSFRPSGGRSSLGHYTINCFPSTLPLYLY